MTGQPSSGHREGPPHRAPASQNAQSAIAQNGLNPGTHSISVLSSISPATGYFGEQGSQDATQNPIIPLQMHLLQGAESLSSKLQQKLQSLFAFSSQFTIHFTTKEFVIKIKLELLN